MKSQVETHSIVIGGHKTSVSLESQFWSGLKEVARQRKVTLSTLVNEIDLARTHSNLSSSLRVHVLLFYRTAYRSAMPLPIEDAA